jgi:hypothetical protein
VSAGERRNAHLRCDRKKVRAMRLFDHRVSAQVISQTEGEERRGAASGEAVKKDSERLAMKRRARCVEGCKRGDLRRLIPG